MGKQDLMELSKLLFKHGYGKQFTVLVAVHIAAEVCSDQEIVKKYGTQACDELRELHNELEAMEVAREPQQTK